MQNALRPTNSYDSRHSQRTNRHYYLCIIKSFTFFNCNVKWLWSKNATTTSSTQNNSSLQRISNEYMGTLTSIVIMETIWCKDEKATVRLLRKMSSENQKRQKVLANLGIFLGIPMEKKKKNGLGRERGILETSGISSLSSKLAPFSFLFSTDIPRNILTSASTLGTWSKPKERSIWSCQGFISMGHAFRIELNEWSAG